MNATIHVASILAVALSAIPASAQSLTWTLRAPGTTSPSARTGHAMAYDSQRGVTVLFGGSGTGGGYLGDTWEWDGTSWTQVATTGPAVRYGPAMAYDSQRGRTVMFGGMGMVPPLMLGDTWEWDGANWTQVATTGPSGRRHGAMAYDSQRGRTVMFGGTQGYPPFSDTWEWDGTSWTNFFAPGPGGSGGPAMAYDSLRGKTVLALAQNPISPFTPSTWEWNGTSWTPVGQVFALPYRVYHGMAYDIQRGKTVLFGGYTTGVWFGDAWEWNGSTWTQVPTSGLSARTGHAMVYDSQRAVTVLFGGQGDGGGLSGDTWEHDPSPSTATTFGTGCGSPAATIAPHAGSRPVMGQSYVSDINNAFLGIAFVAWGSSDRFWGATPLPVSLAPFGFAGCLLWHSADGDLAMGCTSTSWNTAKHTVAIPYAPSLVGVQVFLQAWTVAPGFNPMDIALSNGLKLVVGDF